MQNLQGSIIQNRYRVDAFLGRGGMADVYKVWDQQRAVYLAMKVLHSDLAEDRAFLRRFKREADTLSKLQHPNIVRSYGLESDGRIAFILMDYIEGESLRARIFERNRPFTASEVIQIMQPVCAALHYAHQNGVVHCDIKPANIMIDKKENVFVSDFGISRITDSATTTLLGAGTPAYMSPEQARGEDLTHLSDIYSLGIVLYEMLSGGERPFTGERARVTGVTSEKVRWEQMNEAPIPLREFNPKIPESVESLVLSFLQKEPRKRPLNALQALNFCIENLAELSPKASLSIGVEGPQVIPPAIPPSSLQPQYNPVQPANLQISTPAQSNRKNRVLVSMLGVFAIGFFVLLFVFLSSMSRQLPAGPIPIQTETPQTESTPTPTQTLFPTLTQTPTVTPTELPTEMPSPTLTITPLPVLSTYLQGITVAEVDDFSSDEGWNVQTGEFKNNSWQISGDNSSWSGGNRKSSISRGQGIIIQFKYTAGSMFEFFISDGQFRTEGYRRFGAVINSNTIRNNLYQGTTRIRQKNLSGNLQLQPYTWYTALISVGQRGDFLIVVWDSNDASQTRYYKENLPASWQGRDWSFRIAVNLGTVDVASYQKILFDQIR